MAAVEIRIRRDTEANWLLANPVLASGEPTVAWKPDGTSYMRVGDGVRVWSELPDSQGKKGDPGDKGDPGTVTPEMTTLRDAAVAARDQAEIFSATSVSLQDGAVAGLVSHEESATSKLLTQQFAGLGALGPRAQTPTARVPYTYLMDLGRPDHGATASPVGVSADLADTTSFFRGTQSARVTTDGNATIAGLRREAFTAINMTKKSVEISIQVSDWDNVDSIYVLLGSGSSVGSTYHQITLYTRYDRPTGYVSPSDPGQWITLTADMTSSTYTSGSPDLSSIRSAQVSFKDRGAGGFTARVNHLAVFDKAPEFPNGVVSVTFDDSYLTHYTVGQPGLARYGMQGTFYTIANLLGSSANGSRYYMSLPELKKLQDGGHEVAAHAYTWQAHNAVGGFTSLSPEGLDAELRGLKNWLVTNGFSGADHLALPQGIRNAEVDAAVKKYFSSQRGTMLRPHDTLKPGPVYNLHAGGMYETRAKREAMIDKAYDNGTWLNFLLHDIVPVVPTPAGTTIPQRSVADWEHLIDYVAAKGMPVRTVGDVLASIR